MKSSAARGKGFEVEVASFLKAAGFDVTPNARAAKPRQTDVFAKGEHLDLLVEAKDQQRNVNVGDIDALRSRLRRTSAEIVGALFTTSGFTKSALKEIESDRTRLVLAFGKEEIERIRSGAYKLRTLIDRKRDELRINGRAWFDTGAHSDFVDVQLPRGNIQFRLGDTASFLLESKSSFAGAFFALEIPDPGWGISGGEGARLTMRLSLYGLKDVRNILGYLHRYFGLSNEGVFSIKQSGSCWQGVGAENFLGAADQWRGRYRKSLSKNFHHSEQLVYFDYFRDGWIELSSQQRTGWTERESFFHNSQLVVQLPGVPVDIAPFLKLCRYTDNDWANFEYVGERSTLRIHLNKPLVLDVVGRVVSPAVDPREEETVRGLIAKNPFYGRKSLPKELKDNQALHLNGLGDVEFVVCSLKDWHDDLDVGERYSLLGFDVTRGGTEYVIRPFATWSKLKKLARLS